MTAHPQVIELLDAAKARNGFTSDRQLGDAVGDSPQVSRWRKGFTLPNKDAAVILAELAGRDPEEVLNLIGFIEAERASQPRAAAVYRGILSRMAVTIALPLCIVVSPENAHASAVHAEAGAAVECILWKVRRWLKLGSFGGRAYA